MHLDVFTFDLLHGLLLICVMLPILVKLREAGSYIIDEQLRQFFIRLDNEAKELAMVVVDDIAKFFLEWERFEVFPSEVLRLKDEDTILQLIDLLRFTRYELIVLAQHAAEYHDVVFIEAESKVVRDFLRHFDIEYSPDAKLSVVSLNGVQKVVFGREPPEEVNVLRATFARACVDARYRYDLTLLTECPFALPY